MLIRRLTCSSTTPGSGDIAQLVHKAFAESRLWLCLHAHEWVPTACYKLAGMLLATQAVKTPGLNEDGQGCMS